MKKIKPKVKGIEAWATTIPNWPHFSIYNIGMDKKDIERTARLNSVHKKIIKVLITPIKK